MTRIYLTRMNESGFKKLARVKYSNLNEDWINLEIKSINDKIMIKMNDKVLMGIEELD